MNNHTLDADLVSMENPCPNIYTNFDTPFDTFIRFHDESSLNQGKTQQDNSEDSHQVTQANNAVISNDMEVEEFEEENVEVITREDGILAFREYPDSEPDQRRYPLRNRNTRKHFDDYSRSSVADLCLKVSDVVPVTYSQAVRSEDS